MDWKEELAGMFSFRKNDIVSISSYQQMLKEVILPTFKEIKDTLHEYSIDVTIDNSKNELKVVACGFVMKTEKDLENIKITFKYLNPIELEEMPPYRTGSEKIISIHELTSDLLGKLFVDAFEPIKVFYVHSK